MVVPVTKIGVGLDIRVKFNFKKKKKAKERGSQIITNKSNKSRWVLGKKPKPQN